MLYPENCLERLGFVEIRQLISKHCLSPMGQAMVQKMQVMNRFDQIDKFLRQTNEFKSILQNQVPLQVNSFFDIIYDSYRGPLIACTSEVITWKIHSDLCVVA